MVNVEALLSPTGGYDYEQTINSGAAGLIGAFLFDKRIFGRFIERPAAQYYYNKINPAGMEYAKARTKAQQIYKTAREGINKARVIPKGTTKGAQIRLDKAKSLRRTRTTRKEKLQAAKKAFMGRDKIATGEKAFMQGLKGSRSLFRGIGITMLLSAGLDLAEAAFTPGISKVSAQKEQQFMAGGSTALDNQASYTMRQRAVMAIHDSMMNVRQVIGNEAQFMHR